MISGLVKNDVAAALKTQTMRLGREATVANVDEQPAELRLREQASEAVLRISDPCNYAAISPEKVYARAPGTAERLYLSAGSALPLDSAIAMLDWAEFIAGGSEANALQSLAIAIGRGIAADFIVGEADADGQRNFGAFREYLALDGRSTSPSPCDIVNRNTFSITATANVAERLFDLHERTGDRICLHAALRASQWLLLRQRPDGSYSGDRVAAGSATIAPDARAGRHATVHAAGAFICAFRESGAEVYIKAAARALRSAAFQIPLTFPQSEPVTRLARNAALMYAESASMRNREDLEAAANLLKQSRTSSVGSSVRETEQEWARAALEMFVILEDAQWLELSLSSLRSASAAANGPGSGSIAAFIAMLLAVPALIPGCRPDLSGRHVRVGRTSYAADAATSKAIDVTALPNHHRSHNVDYLPLVSKIGNSVLIPVLASKAVTEVDIRSGVRHPNLTDLATGDIVSQPAPLHDLPFSSDYRWGCFVIEQ